MADEVTQGRKLDLRVVFETSVLYTGSESNLMRLQVEQLIRENSKHPDLQIEWYLPEIVMHERQYQMQQRALGLLPSIEKLERLLGHRLNITEDLIRRAVKEAIQRDCDTFKLHIASLDTASVHWEDLILNAIYRKPPFQEGEKEKGFRDAIIVETFSQIVHSAPVTPRICRIALVTGDGLVQKAATDSTADRTNVRILPTLEELEGLINTLASDMTEEFVANIQQKAAKCFFEQEDKKTLYYKENISAQIVERFVAELQKVPAGADVRENGTWRIAQPRFLKKEGQRVYWISPISVEAVAYAMRTVEPSMGLPIDVNFQNLPASEPASRALLESLLRPSDRSYLDSLKLASDMCRDSTRRLLFEDRVARYFCTPGQSSSKQEIVKGKSLFEIEWSVSISVHRYSLSQARVEDIRYIETQWG